MPIPFPSVIGRELDAVGRTTSLSATLVIVELHLITFKFNVEVSLDNLLPLSSNLPFRTQDSLISMT